MKRPQHPGALQKPAAPRAEPVAHEAPVTPLVQPEQPPLREEAGTAQVRRAAKVRRRYERAERKRFTAASRRRRRNWLIAGGVSLALVLGVAVVAFSPAMSVRVIEVAGTSRIPAASIVTALGTQVGTPLALVDQGAVHDELAAFTLIQSYSVEAKLPDTLLVRVVERDPIGAVKTASGFDLVDSAGVVISSTPDLPAGFPQLEAVSPTAIAAAGEVMRSLPAEIRAQVTSVRAETRDDVTLELGPATTVVWGSADDSSLKAAVFASLLAVAPGVSRYDVSAPDSPVYS